ncbi:MAG: hypothetical protein JXA71_05355 [Chitinispirillaceae bacterium]|nr:hypothetical protein [Chitinispirillaceae bacterium]
MKPCSPGIIIVTAIVTQFYCASLNPEGGNGSGVGNGMIAGVMYNPDGSRAKNATVQAVPADYNPFGGLGKTGVVSRIKSTTTDDTGGFVIDSLPEQVFNVFGSDNANRLLIDSVRISKQAPAILPPDTLRAPGAVNGIIRLLPEHDSRSVIIIVIGTTVWTAPEDSAGNFKLHDMAKGRYRVRFLTAQQGYLPLDTMVYVNAGSIDSLADTLRLKFTGIPVPQGFRAAYDTLKQLVALAWNKADPALVSGYALYRSNFDSNGVAAVIYKGMVNDTLYIDSTALQDMRYEYRVAAVNGLGEEGSKSRGVTVTIAGIFTVVDSMVKGDGALPGQFGYMTRISLDSAGNMYITDTKNNRLQKFDSAGNFIFMDDAFLLPVGVAMAGNSGLLVSDFGDKKVVKMDFDGRRVAVFSTRGKPLSALSAGDRQYVVSDSGIEVFSSDGSLIRLINSNVGNYHSGDITADDAGTIIVVLGDKVYRYDEQSGSLTRIHQITDTYSNQNCRAVFLSPEIILLLANNNSSPFYSTVFALGLNGAVIAKWNSRQNMRDIYPKNDREVIAVTEDGKMLKLNLEKEMH